MKMDLKYESYIDLNQPQLAALAVFAVASPELISSTVISMEKPRASIIVSVPPSSPERRSGRATPDARERI
jgi:hypothetical protein